MTKQNERTKKRRQNSHKKIVTLKKDSQDKYLESIDPDTPTGQCIVDLDSPNTSCERSSIYDGNLEDNPINDFEIIDKDSTDSSSTIGWLLNKAWSLIR